jgi:hypothetical protein
MLAMLHRFRPAWMAEQDGMLRALAAAAEARTTAVGGHFLLHALAGSFSELVLAVAEAETPTEAERAAAELLRFGASSGADTLTGMRLALAAMTPQL